MASLTYRLPWIELRVRVPGDHPLLPGSEVFQLMLDNELTLCHGEEIVIVI